MGLVFYSGSFLTGSDEDINYNSAVELGSIGVSEISDAIQILINSQSLGTLTSSVAIYITGSSPDPLVGMGTTNPLSNLDIRSTTGSSPANLILRTNEDGVIQEGEETGRIIFAIESSSYNFDDGFSFVSSGSTAAIFSRVTNAHPANGAYGSLVFEVNDSTDRTAPVEAMTIGYGEDPTFNGVGISVSASMVITSNYPTLRIENDNTGYQIARLGGHSPTDLEDGQLLLYNQGNISTKINADASPADASFIRYGNFAVGTTTAPEKLTVEGSISASGDIIGNINGGSF